MLTYIEATADKWKAFCEHSHEGAVVMLNLLRFDPDNDGRSRYGVYAEQVMPLLAQCGGEVVYVGAVEATVIGGESWDQIILVRYPSKQVFIDMIESEAYQAVAPLRNEALLDSRLLMTVEQASL